ncbi:MAG: hypothetical protein HZC29_03950 [Thaumarchaeota archaeon]|nr:hypothetical protein [Nitrososphaerota archaeon]
MQTQFQTKIAPWVLFVALGVTVFSVLALTTIAPVSYWMPISVTESAKVIGVTEDGCVVDVSYGYPITTKCDAVPGDVIQVTYNVPGVMQSNTSKEFKQECHLFNLELPIFY